jgi:hypothetical protein
MRLICDVCRTYKEVSHIVYLELSTAYYCGRCNEKRQKKERAVAAAKRTHYERRFGQGSKTATFTKPTRRAA